ncbi:MAG: hypothetical protein TE42_04910 [Candidatus Synechococcus spongiarum SP3]|uniref:Uncharacterized protein n=1 Tax=Candidatus Synechococcus spongiarum SP3 TaxID=1604020 RepID=A0A0G2HL13_9SYNE|nr:MAG: hypothetical protein TE42_04910 [Candidatus Synechococcus spongiarum SP3]
MQTLFMTDFLMARGHLMKKVRFPIFRGAHHTGLSTQQINKFKRQHQPILVLRQFLMMGLLVVNPSSG